MRTSAINRSFAVLLLSGLLTLASTPSFAQDTSPNQGAAQQIPGVAVLELFTSEGCHACPPAEALLGQIAKLADEQGLPVFSLAMHVDYFDRPGQRDPYSSGAFTRRQRNYASRDGERGMFTPQMVVNGALKFSGTDVTAAEDAIARALSVPTTAEIDLQVNTDEDQGVWNLRYEIQNAQEGDLLNVALIEDNTSPGGAAGARRSHAAVVREFASVRLGIDGKGEVSLPLPRDVQAPSQELRVIAYVQDRQMLITTGAAQWSPTENID